MRERTRVGVVVASAVTTVLGLGLASAPGHAADVRAREASPLVGQVKLAGTTKGPFDMAVSRSGRQAVVVGGDRLERLALGAGRPRVVGRAPQAAGERVALHPSGRFAYVLSAKTRLRVVDLRGKRPRVVRTLGRRALAPSSVMDVEIAPNGRHLFVLHGTRFGGWGTGGGVQVLSLATPARPRKLARVRFGQSDGRLAIGARGKRLYATDHRRDVVRSVAIAKPGRPRVAATRSLPYEVIDVAASYDGGGVFASGWSGGSVAVSRLNAKNLRVTRDRRYPLSGTPSGLGVSADGRRVHLTLHGAPSQITYLRLASGTLRDVGVASGIRSPQFAVPNPRRRGPARIYLADYPGSTGGRPTLLAFRS